MNKEDLQNLLLILAKEEIKEALEDISNCVSTYILKVKDIGIEQEVSAHLYETAVERGVLRATLQEQQDELEVLEEYLEGIIYLCHTGKHIYES